MTPTVWKNMTRAARACYAERNELLWDLVRAVRPGSGGNLDDMVPKAIREAWRLRIENEQLRKRNDQLLVASGEVTPSDGWFDDGGEG